MQGETMTITELRQREMEKVNNKLLEFVQRVKKQSCCNVCECISCEAHKLLRELGYE